MRLIFRLLVLDGTLLLNLFLLIIYLLMVFLLGDIFLNALMIINLALLIGFIRLSYADHQLFFKMHNVKRLHFVAAKTVLLLILLITENSLILMV